MRNKTVFMNITLLILIIWLGGSISFFIIFRNLNSSEMLPSLIIWILITIYYIIKLVFTNNSLIIDTNIFFGTTALACVLYPEFITFWIIILPYWYFFLKHIKKIDGVYLKTLFRKNTTNKTTDNVANKVNLEKEKEQLTQAEITYKVWNKKPVFIQNIILAIIIIIVNVFIYFYSDISRNRLESNLTMLATAFFSLTIIIFLYNTLALLLYLIFKIKGTRLISLLFMAFAFIMSIAGIIIALILFAMAWGGAMSGGSAGHW